MIPRHIWPVRLRDAVQRSAFKQAVHDRHRFRPRQAAARLNYSISWKIAAFGASAYDVPSAHAKAPAIKRTIKSNMFFFAFTATLLQSKAPTVIYKFSLFYKI